MISDTTLGRRLGSRGERKNIPRAGARAQRWATTALGALLVAEGAGKLLSPRGYFAALAAFRALPQGALPLIGTIWMALELSCGLGLVAAGLAKFASRTYALPAAVGALALQLGYAALSTQAFARGLHIGNCTCFGVYLAQRLSWFVLLQDAYMIAYAGWQLLKIRRWPTRTRASRTGDGAD